MSVENTPTIIHPEKPKKPEAKIENWGYVDIQVDPEWLERFFIEWSVPDRIVDNLKIIFREAYYADRNSGNAPIAGYFNPESQTIEIFTSLQLNENSNFIINAPLHQDIIKGALLHELRHLVQLSKGEALPNTMNATQDEYYANQQEQDAESFSRNRISDWGQKLIQVGDVNMKTSQFEEIMQRQQQGIDLSLRDFCDFEKCFEIRRDVPHSDWRAKADAVILGLENGKIDQELLELELANLIRLGDQLANDHVLGLHEYNIILQKIREAATTKNHYEV